MSSSLNHYMSKRKITRAIIEGTPATALCGETFTPSHQGSDAVAGNETESRKLKVCPVCELFFSGLLSDAEVRQPEAVNI